MKSFQYFFYYLVCLAVISCQEPPELSNIPRIEFQSLRIVDVPNSPFDSIVLNVFFEDGDADLGVNSSEVGNRPYHNEDYIFRQEGGSNAGVSLIRSRELNDPEFQVFILELVNGVLIQGNSFSFNFKDSIEFTSSDAPPLFDNLNRFNSFNWQTSETNDLIVAVTSNGDVVSFESGSPPPNVGLGIIDTIRQLEDTVWIVPNDFRNNYFIDLLIEEDNGNFETADLAQILGPSGIGAFDGRFDFIGESVGQNVAVEGTVTRQFSTTAFNTLFFVNPVLRNSNLRFRVQITDRALNRSNFVETQSFRPADLFEF